MSACERSDSRDSGDNNGGKIHVGYETVRICTIEILRAEFRGL
jgi:hypothetical protein